MSTSILPPLTGKDDAQSAHYISIDDIIHGTVVLAFGHAVHLLFVFEKLLVDNTENQLDKDTVHYLNDEQYSYIVDCLKIIKELSIMRNKRLMNKINERLIILNNVLPTEEQKTLHSFVPTQESDKETLRTQCGRLSINPDGYFDEKNDSTEVDGCTNEWCLNQLNEVGQASDAVRIIIDSLGVHWVVLIIRVFAPGIGNYSIAGGFLDSKLEKFNEAADRECDEEVDGLTGLTEKHKFELPLQESKEWDSRARFAKHGMCVGGNAVIYVQTKNPSNQPSCCNLL